MIGRLFGLDSVFALLGYSELSILSSVDISK